MAPALKELLIDFLSQELDYLEKIGRVRSPNDQRAALQHDLKLKFETSVPQLAYLFKIFIDQKILINSNITETSQFLVRYVISRHAETISYASFRAKFYNVEDGTKKAVRSMLV